METAFQKYSRYIKEMKLHERKSRYCQVSSSLRSTELMTDLRHRLPSGRIDPLCEEPYDILYAGMLYKKHFPVTLVIVYDIPATYVQELDKEYYSQTTGQFEENRITFTELKKSKFWKWIDIDENRRKEDIPVEKGSSIHLWERPFVLEASTDYDKDFRKEWRFGDLIYEGNNYGDTTDFYIIGTLERTAEWSYNE